MAISISGNSHYHLHHPCPRCGYATRFKQWGIRCLCNRHCSKDELNPPPRRNLADDLPVGHPSGPPLQIAPRYATGRPRIPRRD